MRCRLALVAGAAILLTAATASAREITLVTEVDAEGGFPTMFFGTDPASGDFAFLDVLVDGALVLTGTGGSIFGDVTFFSGPLLSLTPHTAQDGTIDAAVYKFAPGEFSFTGQWELPDGSIKSGGATLPLLDLTIETCEETGASDRCIGIGGTAEFTAILGSGFLDPALQHVLHVPRFVTGGTFAGSLDFVEGDITDASRISGAPNPWRVGITVPEPALATLMLVAGAAALWRRRRGGVSARR